MYSLIFFTNVLLLLQKRGMTRRELSKRSHVSIAFLSDLTSGKANPSLRIMEAIADALETSLPILLESTDLDREALKAIAAGKAQRDLPEGYECVSAVLSKHKAFIVKKWNEETIKRLRIPREI